MILISRFLTYFLPLIYFVGGLLWMLRPQLIYYTVGLLAGLLLLNVYMVLKLQWQWQSFVKELIDPFVFLIVSLLFLIFVPQNWQYVFLILFFSLMFYVLLSDLFARYHPFLSINRIFEGQVKVVYYTLMIFFLTVGAYNFVLFLNYNLWVVVLTVIALIVLMVHNISQVDWSEEWLVRGLFLVTTWELFLILYYLPIDIYIKGLIVSVNWFLLSITLLKNKFYKLQQIYAQEKK